VKNSGLEVANNVALYNTRAIIAVRSLYYRPLVVCHSLGRWQPWGK